MAVSASIPVSLVLQRLHDSAPPDTFTLAWLMGSLRKRSFGIIILLLGLAAVAPGVAFAAGLLLMIPGCQLILGHARPVFPRRIANRPIPIRHLAALVQRTVPVLRRIETLIHPRWRTPAEATGRLVGGAVVLLSAILVFIPVPFSNVIPALAIVLIALAWLEEDGMLLTIALLCGLGIFAVAVAMAWEALRGAEWIARLL